MRWVSINPTTEHLVGMNHISLSAPVVWGWQLKLSQSFLIGQVLKALHHAVALHWTCSTNFWSALLKGPHTRLSYSRCGLTRDLKRVGRVRTSIRAKDWRITARIWNVLATTVAACYLNFKSWSIWMLRSFSTCTVFSSVPSMT